jgi:hypothetical protein
LKAEAERLRTRLRKVEAGIKRWEALLQALSSSQPPTSMVEGTGVRPFAGDATEPVDLNAIPAARSRPK